MLAFLVRGLAVGVPLIHALITGVSQQFNGGSYRHAALLEQGEVVNFTGTCRNAQNGLIVAVNHDLSFLSMAFLLAGVEPTLFF